MSVFGENPIFNISTRADRMQTSLNNWGSYLLLEQVNQKRKNTLLSQSESAAIDSAVRERIRPEGSECIDAEKLENSKCATSDSFCCQLIGPCLLPGRIRYRLSRLGGLGIGKRPNFLSCSQSLSGLREEDGAIKFEYLLVEITTGMDAALKWNPFQLNLLVSVS